MIYDSFIWREELKHLKDQICSFKLEDIENFKEEEFSDGEILDFELQKYCFFSGVIVRKFIESNRLSDEILSAGFSIKEYAKKSTKTVKKEDLANLHQVYNLTLCTKKTLTLEKICNLFIHSFAFLSEFSDLDINKNQLLSDQIKGVYINTDYSKEECLYYLDLNQIFKVFDDVLKDKIVYIYENRITGDIRRSRKASK